MAKRHRSPSYPSLSLENAIEKVGLFYKKETFHKAPASVAIEHIGYAEGSSRGYRALASLLRLGLIVGEGTKYDREVWLSELGKDIVAYNEPGTNEYNEALKRAALNPAIHQKLWKLWVGEEEKSLPSDANMRKYLLKDLLFNPNSVDSFIRVFKSTLTFANLLERDIMGEDERIDPNIPPETPPDQKPLLKARKIMDSPQAEIQDNTIPLIGGGTAILRAPVPLSRRNYEHIMKWFEFMKDALIYEENKPQTGSQENLNE